MARTISIDGYDIATTYGATIIKGGYKSLVQWPATKDVESNDWQEYDGIEADLSAPMMKARNISIPLWFKTRAGYDSMLSAMVASITHQFADNYIGRTFSLRYAGCTQATMYGDAVEATLLFVEDEPMKNYTYLAPISTAPFDRDYSMGFATRYLAAQDGALVLTQSNAKIDVTAELVSAYGMRVLKGTNSNAAPAGEVKEPMARDIKTCRGLIIDKSSPVKMRSRDLVIRCLMHEASNTALWRNYDALLYLLTTPNAKEFNIARTGQSFKCYYKSQQVEEYAPENAWLKFTITMHIINQTKI